MFEAIKHLLDSKIINEETRDALQAAWDAKLAEATDSIRAEVRQEMAERYQHDKQVMVEALDRMTSDMLKTEIVKIAEERRALAEDRVKFNNKMLAKASDFEAILESRLSEELKELHEERKKQNAAMSKLDAFVTEGLTKELSEFAQDKADLARARVAIVTENKAKLQRLQDSFIKRSAELVERTVEHTLRSELTQLKKDIQEAKQNDFGRKIFEAFATEYGATHLNERAEVKKMTNAIESFKRQLGDAHKAKALAESKAKASAAQVQRINESHQRAQKINDLLKPLSREKAEVMRELLESVQTDRLGVAFKKYLSPVMDGKTIAKAAPAAQPLVESKTAHTGDRAAASVGDNIIDMKRLAGLVK